MNVTLIELDPGKEWDRYTFSPVGNEIVWSNYAPGVWFTTLTANFSMFAASLFNGSVNNWFSGIAGIGDWGGAITRVGSVLIDEVSVPNAGSLPALLTLTEAGFYWDQSQRILYVRFANHRPPAMYRISIGKSVRIAKEAWIDEDAGLIYDPEIVSMPIVSKTIDPLFFGRLQFNDVTITLENRHAEYDLFAGLDVYGQEVRILRGETDMPYANFRRVWTGYIDDFVLREDTVDIRASDTRKLLEVSLPTGYFSRDMDPPYNSDQIDERDVGKVIPIAYGQIVGFNPMCVNKDIDRVATPTDYSFAVCDTSNHDGVLSIDEARYKGQVVSFAGAPDTATGIFVIAQADLEDANGRVDYRDIEVDFVGLQRGGVAIQNGMDVIRDIIEVYAEIPFSNVRYDEAQWNAITALVPDVGFYIDRDSLVIDEIEKIAASIRIQFDILGDGRFSALRYDPDAPAVTSIGQDENLDGIIAEYTSDQFSSRLIIEYMGGIYRFDEFEQQIRARYKRVKPQEVTLILTNETDVQEYAEAISSFLVDFPPLFSVRIPIDNTRDLNIEDNVNIVLDRRQEPWFGNMKCRIEGITYNFDENTMELSLRGIRPATEET